MGYMIDLMSMKKTELVDLIMAYDRYIIDYIDEHGVCQDGCCPACLSEFADNDYPVLKGEED